MQAVILAAGKSERFYPYTNYGHKALIKVLGKTILEQTLLSIKKADITDVVIVTGKENPIEKIIGDGSHLGVAITYVVQPEPLGMGDALLHAESSIHDDFFLLHASHVDFHEFKKVLEEKKRTGVDNVLLAREVINPEHFGILRIEGDKVLEITEKPTRGKEPSNLKVIGVYLLSHSFFKTLKGITQEHYSFEKALTEHAEKTTMSFVKTDIVEVSLKYPWDVLQISNYLLTTNIPFTSDKAIVSPHAIIVGDVIVEAGAKIMEGACIKGPCYIGKNAIIGNNAIVRNKAVIGEGVVIGANMEVKNSVFLDNTTTHSGFIGDSVVGSNCKIAANFHTGNVRLDREENQVTVGEKEVKTGRNSLGVIMGDGVSIGIGVSTMPGLVIGNKAVIGPATMVSKNIAPDTLLYTTFETVEKKRAG
ncbi:MAG: bifunctional sugar-1-phosphate nucleotidylyltransferase/acetyltransferase [Patescibacteria group bacterium]